MTDLAQAIQTTRMVDTHEHTFSEDVYVLTLPNLLAAGQG